MSKNSTTKNTKGSYASAKEAEEIREEESSARFRAPTPIKYERIRQTDIPQEVIDAFTKHDTNIRFVRFEGEGGRVDNQNLARRIKQDGYDFVTKDDLKALGLEWYISFFEDRELKGRAETLTSGDVVLMKNHVDTKKQRQQDIYDRTQKEIDAVNLMGNVAKKKGFVDTGSKSSVSYKEPSFGD